MLNLWATLPHSLYVKYRQPTSRVRFIGKCVLRPVNGGNSWKCRRNSCRTGDCIAALKASDKKDHLRVNVSGDVQGDTMKVNSVKLL